MTKEEFSNLDRGDIVRSKADHKSFVVDSNYGNRVTAVRTMDLTNPDEWDLIVKAHRLDEREKLTIRIALEEWKFRMAGANQAVGFVDPDDDGMPFSRTESLDKLIDKLR